MGLLNSGGSSKLKRARVTANHEFPHGYEWSLTGLDRFDEVQVDNVALNPSGCPNSMETAPSKSNFAHVSRQFLAERDFPPSCGRQNSYSVSKDGLSNTNIVAEPLEKKHVRNTAGRRCPAPRILRYLSAKDFPAGKQGSCSVSANVDTTDERGCQNHDTDSKGNVDSVTSIRSSVDPFQESSASRRKVQEVLELYQETVDKLLQEYEANGKVSKKPAIYREAAMILKRRQKWLNTKRLGHIPGVKTGDRFRFRTELSVIGLHCNFYDGIDHMKKDGRTLATCIVVTDRYANEIKSPDTLIYIGHGGKPLFRTDQPRRDQKLERGNLALKNSMDSRTPVRVIRQQIFKSSKATFSKGKNQEDNGNLNYVYDGLYLVEKCWQDRGELGKLVFKFQLKRVAGQPDVFWGLVNKQKARVLMNDISQGNEKIPVRVSNGYDDERPPSFDYVGNTIYPKSHLDSMSIGCDCADGCSNDEDCSCKIKNGGELPYNHNAAIAMKKPLIYECGPSCKCSSSCNNRVSQNGLQVELELFKDQSKGWGVRSRSYIRSGSFVCEYTGEIIQKKEAKHGPRSDGYCLPLGPQGGFAIDATRCGNVGRFIKHSCSPNLYAQNVLYDHDDRRMPHIMLFATRDIPPNRELTFDHTSTDRSNA